MPKFGWHTQLTKILTLSGKQVIGDDWSDILTNIETDSFRVCRIKDIEVHSDVGAETSTVGSNYES